MPSYLEIAARRVRVEGKPISSETRADIESTLDMLREPLQLLYECVAPELRKQGRIALEDHTYIERVLGIWRSYDYRERGVVHAAIVDYAKEHRAARDLKTLTG